MIKLAHVNLDRNVFISLYHATENRVILRRSTTYTSPSAEADSPSRPPYIVHPKQYILTPPLDYPIL